MTKEQFDLKYRGDKLAVHCDTEKKAKAFLKLAKRFGYKWESGNDLEKISYWECNKENTCYRFFDNFVVYSFKRDYKFNGYKIVEFELEKENDMKFKVGQKVRVKTDLKNNNNYGGVFFNKEMESVVGNVFTIGSIPLKNVYKLSDFARPDYLWTDEMLEPVEETFKVGDEVYDLLSNRNCTIEVLAYLVKFDKGGLSFRKISELSHKKPLTKITKEQLAEMGYEVD